MKLIEEEETYTLEMEHCNMTFTRDYQGLSMLRVFLETLLEGAVLVENVDLIDNLNGVLACIEAEVAGVPLTIQ